MTCTNTIAEQRTDPHITVEGVWAHVKRSLANLAVVDAVDQRDEVALAHVPPQLVPLVGRFQARLLLEQLGCLHPYRFPALPPRSGSP
ncbi:hypothetical protein ACIBW9_33790 [Streptomyces sp. NPDC049541]|uniref:hypothetical protein n=1 Tax=Streptomyces sp. NPDC049541 TaxID=3365594 RepID=UPI0037AB4203